MRPKVAKKLAVKSKVDFIYKGKELFVGIQTDRLYIRSYRPEDFKDCVALYGDPTITQYFDHGRSRSRNEVEELIHEKGNKYFLQGEPFGLFSIFYKDDMSFLGQIDLLPSDEPGEVEIGFILHEKFQNQGFCTEAVRAFLFDFVEEINNHGFKCKGMPITRVIATAHPENEPSKALLKKVGMTLDKFQERFSSPRLWYSYPLTNNFFGKL